MNLQLLKDLLDSSLANALPQFVLERAIQHFQLEQMGKSTTLTVEFVPLSQDRNYNTQSVIMRLIVSHVPHDTPAPPPSQDSTGGESASPPAQTDAGMPF